MSRKLQLAGLQVCGAVVRDQLTGNTFTVRAKSVINATGPFTDAVRQMDSEEAREIVCPSAGVHIILPDYYRCIVVLYLEFTFVGLTKLKFDLRLVVLYR